MADERAAEQPTADRPKAPDRRQLIVIAAVAVVGVVLAVVGAMMLSRDSGSQIDYAALARYQTARTSEPQTEDVVRSYVEDNGWECDGPNSGAWKRALALEDGHPNYTLLGWDYFICGEDYLRELVDGSPLTEDQRQSILRRIE